ncbi:UNVERIFIED_ORG: hypothetical protein LHK14_17850 [Roseateles sp. XES5]|nr:hypothetical protein [Roseateles sp. XES5]
MTIGELEQLAGVPDRKEFWMGFVNDQSIPRDDIFTTAVAELRRRAIERGTLPAPPPDRKRKGKP